MAKKSRKIPKLGVKKQLEKNCIYCNNIFFTFNPNQLFCSKKCRKKSYHPKIYSKKDIIDNIRNDFLNLKRLDPSLAQKIADEMELLEGKQFRDEVLDGLAPFSNPKKNKKNN